MAVDDPITFGEYLADLMYEHGKQHGRRMTQEALGDGIGRSGQLIKWWLDGKRIPKLDTPYVTAIADYLHLPDEQRRRLETAQRYSLLAGKLDVPDQELWRLALRAGAATDSISGAAGGGKRARLEVPPPTPAPSIRDLQTYLTGLVDTCGRSRLLERFGRRLSDVHVSLQALPYAPVEDAEELRAREHFRTSGVSSALAFTDEVERLNRRVWRWRGTGAPDDENAGSHSSLARPQPLDGLVGSHRLVVVLGDPGSGKTVWLEQHASAAARRAMEALEGPERDASAVRLPIYLRLRDVAATVERTRRSGDTWLRSELHKLGCRHNATDTLTRAERGASTILVTLIADGGLPRRLAPWLWQRLLGVDTEEATSEPTAARGGLLLCLDAWDEVQSTRDAHGGQPGLTEFVEALSALAEVPSTSLVVTSRIMGYGVRPLRLRTLDDAPLELQICPFTWADTRAFVSKFFPGEPQTGEAMLASLAEKPAVAGMAQNPLLATLLCLCFIRDPEHVALNLPATRAEVYDRVLRGLLGEWRVIETDEPLRSDLVPAKLRLLEELAAAFFPAEEFDASEVDYFLHDPDSGYLARLSGSDPLKQLGPTVMDALRKDGVLVPAGGGAEPNHVFVHLTFQEYLVARWYRQRIEKRGWDAAPAQVLPGTGAPSIRDLLDGRAWQPAWQEIITLLAGLLRDPTPLLELLVDPARDDFFRHRLALAARCLADIPTEKRAAIHDFVDRVGTLLVEEWTRYQQGEVIVAVPHLTRSLPALGQIEATVEGLPLFEDVAARLGARAIQARKDGALLAGCLGTSVGPLVIERLIALIRGRDGEVRSLALWALGRLGPAAVTPAVFETLARALALHDPWVSADVPDALERLAQSGDLAPFFDALFRVLLEPEPELNSADDLPRDAVAAIAERFGPLAGTATGGMMASMLLRPFHDFEPLARVLRPLDGFPGFLEQIAGALSRRDLPQDVLARLLRLIRELGPAAAGPPLLRELARLVRQEEGDEEGYFRLLVVSVIEAIGTAAACDEIIDTAVGLLDEANAWYAWIGGRIARQMPVQVAERYPDVIDRLVRVLDRFSASDRGHRWRARGQAIQILGKLGARAARPDVLTRLTALMKKPPETRDVARYALAWLQFGSTVTLDAATLATAGLLEKVAALQRLAEQPDLAQQPRAAEALAQLIGDRDAAIREQAVKTAAGLADDAIHVSVRQALVDRLDDKDDIAWETKLALDRLGKRDPEADLPRHEPSGRRRTGLNHEEERYLVERLHSPDWEERQTAVAAVGSLARHGLPPALIREVIERLNDQMLTVRYAAVKAVGQFDPAAVPDELVNALQRALDLSGDDLEAPASASADQALIWARRFLDRDQQRARQPNKELAELRTVLDNLPRELIDGKASRGQFVEEVAEVIGQLGERAATPELVDALARHLLTDEDADVRAATGRAFARLMAQGVRIFHTNGSWKAKTVAQLSR